MIQAIPQSSPKESSAIDSELVRISAMLQNLAGIGQHMEARLSLVLAPEVAALKAGQETRQPHGCELEGRLMSIREELQARMAEFEKIHSRICL